MVFFTRIPLPFKYEESRGLCMTAITYLSAAAESVGDILGGAGMTILTGVVVVFGVLILLTAIFVLFGKVMVALKGKPKDGPAPDKPAPAKPAAVSAVKPAAPVSSAGDSEEIIAVISAAVAAMSAADGTTYAVRSIRRADGRSRSERPVWAAAGLLDNVRPF